MRTLFLLKSICRLQSITLVAGAMALVTSPAFAADGTWTLDGNGTWSTPGNWASSTIADGAGFTANFSTIDITANTAVTLDTSRSIGAILVGDTTLPARSYTLGASGGSTLTMDNNGLGATITGNGLGGQIISIPLVLADNLTITKSVSNTLTITGGITGTGNIVIDNDAGSSAIGLTTVSINNAGTITNSGGGAGIANLGGSGAAIGANVTSIIQNSPTSTLNLAGNNVDFAGTIQVQAGTFINTLNTSLNANNTVIVSAGAVFQTNSGTAPTIAGLDGSGGTVQGGSTTLARQLRLGGDGSYSFSGAITDNGAGVFSIEKAGNGTQTLGGANTYTGTTTVSAGTLVIGDGSTGSIGNSTISVSAGILTGNLATGNNIGTTGTPLTTIGNGTGTADSIITGGNSAANSIGRLAMSGGLTLNSDANFVFDLNSTAGLADQVIVAGTTTINALTQFTFNFAGNGAGLFVGQTFTAIGGAGAISGTFSNLAESGVYTFGDYEFTANNYVTSGDLIFTVSAIPEPGTWALVAFSLTTVMVLRRRRRA